MPSSFVMRIRGLAIFSSYRNQKVKKRPKVHFSTFRKNSDRCLPSWCRTRRCCCGTLRTEAAAITFTRICRLQLCFLTRRNEVRMLLEVLNDLFANDLSFESAKSRLDRFVIIYYYSCHFFSHLLFGKRCFGQGPISPLS